MSSLKTIEQIGLKNITQLLGGLMSQFLLIDTRKSKQHHEKNPLGPYNEILSKNVLLVMTEKEKFILNRKKY